MIRLPWTEAQIEMVAEAPWVSPPFAGSMHRGALAMALRRLVCVMRRTDCNGCPLVGSCLYPRLFETRPMAEAPVMRRYERVPHPLVMVAALEDGGGEAPGAETVRLRLFGPEVAQLPFVLRAAEDMARRGLGSGRVPFHIASLRVGHGPVIPSGGNYPPPEVLPAPPALPPRQRWRLLSPLRLMAGGRPLDASRVTGPLLGRALLRRVGLMAQFYGDFGPDSGPAAAPPDFAALAAEADRVRLVEARLGWRMLRRWSQRQRAQQSIGGMIGDLVLDFTAAPALARLADWVPVVHLGKETSMGLGHIAAEAA